MDDRPGNDENMDEVSGIAQILHQMSRSNKEPESCDEIMSSSIRTSSKESSCASTVGSTSKCNTILEGKSDHSDGIRGCRKRYLGENESDIQINDALLQNTNAEATLNSFMTYRRCFDLQEPEQERVFASSMLPREKNAMYFPVALSPNQVLHTMLQNALFLESQVPAQVKACFPSISQRNIYHREEKGFEGPFATASATPNKSRPRKKTKKDEKICRMEGCTEIAAARTPYCGLHCGSRKCEHQGCHKCAQGRTRYCIAHGGGRRCKVPGCMKGARDKSFCAAHGGGKRCTEILCERLAVGKSDKCTSHGGGKRCQATQCTKSAQSGTMFCVRHGGGRKCEVDGCLKAARGRSKLCTSHGGADSFQTSS